MGGNGWGSCARPLLLLPTVEFDVMMVRTTLFIMAGLVGWFRCPSYGADAEVLIPRVPMDQIAVARTWVNPIPPSPENIEKGKALFQGKAFCATCHGRDGKGLSDIPGLRGRLPRDFTDKVWQQARTDGELVWILKNGSPGTDMASFIPLILTEEEAWHLILYVRSFGQ